MIVVVCDSPTRHHLVAMVYVTLSRHQLAVAVMVYDSRTRHKPVLGHTRQKFVFVVPRRTRIQHHNKVVSSVSHSTPVCSRVVKYTVSWFFGTCSIYHHQQSGILHVFSIPAEQAGVLCHSHTPPKQAVVVHVFPKQPQQPDDTSLWRWCELSAIFLLFTSYDGWHESPLSVDISKHLG